MPFWSDNGVLFLAGKGDGNIRYYECEGDTLHPLSEYKSSDPQRGMCFLPRRALNVSECEIARAYKITASGLSGTIEPIGFVVPRKADSFQADIFPPAPSLEPSLDAGTFFTSRNDITRKVISLDTGFTSTLNSSTYQNTLSAPSEPTSAITPTSPVPPSITSKTPSSIATSGLGPTFSSNFQAAPAAQEFTAGNDMAYLVDENARLNGELREARSQIRSLELQLEAMRANAQRAAKVLLDN